jgi:hypothetical protein
MFDNSPSGKNILLPSPAHCNLFFGARNGRKEAQKAQELKPRMTRMGGKLARAK